MKTRKGPGSINGVNPGQKTKGVQKGIQKTEELQSEARHWKTKVDLTQKLVFPDVVQTSLRPDIN